MKKYNCNICQDNLWKIMKNLYTGQEFAVRCNCKEDTKQKNYKDFIDYNSQKYMLLDDYIKQFGQDSPPLKDGELSEIIANTMVKAEKLRQERKQQEEVPF